jgi:sulfide dehydrogenase [flavocytochrome c] flavoprotein subunit
MTELARRSLLAGAAALAVAAPRRPSLPAAPSVVIAGAGFAGATCAKYLRKYAPGIAVTLVDRNPIHVACPGSNEVLVGLKRIQDLQRNVSSMARGRGVSFVQGEIASIDPARRSIRLSNGQTLAGDALVVAPGIGFRWGAVQGYTQATESTLPHAWIAGPQTETLSRRLQGLPANPTVIVTVPRAPYRCPPAPYERASLIAWYLAKSGKRGRVLILDANDSFPKQAVFEEVWRTLYPGAVQRVPASQDGEVVAIDAANRIARTRTQSYQGHLLNVIPPQQAGPLAQAAGLTDNTGWCPVDPRTFESNRVSGVWVIGDSALTNLPRSAAAGMGAAKVAAAAIATRLVGRAADEPLIINTCYSTVAKGQAIGIVTVFGLQGSQFAARNGATGTTPVGAGAGYWREEYEDAVGWWRNMLADAFNP